jgi:hypothetical protein
MVIWFILWPFGIFYGHLVYVYLLVNWHIFHVLVYCAKKNLATLLLTRFDVASPDKAAEIFDWLFDII